MFGFARAFGKRKLQWSASRGPMMSEANHSRRAERVPIVADISLRRSFETRYSVRILDFSPHGARVELVERVRPGDRLWISLPGIETLEAITCWVDDFIAGVEFVHPLHPSVFDMLTARMLGSP